MRNWSARRLKRAVREGVDSLPMGVCFFDRAGLPVLCNWRMQDVVTAMTGRGVRNLRELRNSLSAAARSGDVTDCRVRLPDGSVWSFSLKPVTEEGLHGFTQAEALDVTALSAEETRLKEADEARHRTLESQEEFQQSTVVITREAETLALKLRRKNELDRSLRMIRGHMERGFQEGERTVFAVRQRETLQRLRDREVTGNAPLDALVELAESLGLHIVLTGSAPDNALTRSLLPLILRECLINTVRHAHGDTLYAALRCEGGWICAEITNNGDAPESPVTEGEGLSRLRERIEAVGGSMWLTSVAAFRLTAILPLPEDERSSYDQRSDR